jgi:hypothetical protein
VNNPDKYKFMIQFKSSPYNIKNTNVKIPDHEKKLLNLIEDGIKNKILKDLPSKYISGFFSAHVVYLQLNILFRQRPKKEKYFLRPFLME